MSRKSLKLGYDIVMEKGPVPRPVALRLWKDKASSKEKLAPQKPFKYMADALLGLASLRLNPQLSCPVVHPDSSSDFCEVAWSRLDPHWALWHRSQDRVQALHHEVTKVPASTCRDFEKYFSENLEAACKADGLDFKALGELIEVINHLEGRKNAPLLYNFGLKFTPAFVQKLHALYSVLFHLRSVVAVDWNAHVDDPSHEAVKVDSITDYIPKADYVVNDALLYWHFQKLSHPFVAGRTSDVKVEKLLVEPLKKAFLQSSHNACHLIDRLPSRFLQAMGPADLEEGLYLVQMDWLLGSEAGLLFRIREELYGLQNGYEKIFWHDLQDNSQKRAFHLSLHFKLDESDLGGQQAA